MWGMAIYFGWCNIVEECLKIGVNPNDEIAYDRISWEGMNEGLWLKKSAVEVVKLNDYADGRVKSRLLSLLKGSN